MANDIKPAKPAKIEIKLHNGETKSLAPDDKICVLRNTTIGDKSDPVPHKGTQFYHHGDAGTLTLGPGCTYTTAGKLAAFEGHWLLKMQREAGEVLVFESAAALLDKPTAELRRIFEITQHGEVLREWEAAERKRATPRTNLLAQLHERIRLWGNWAPVQVSTISQAAATG